MSNLDDYRSNIDSIDSEIVKLLEQRFELCNKIGQYKKENNLPILNQNREDEVLEKNLKKIEMVEYSSYIKAILISIMDNSKDIQNSITSSDKEE